MDPISIAMGLAQFAPNIIKWVSGSDKAAEAAQQVVDLAQTVTGDSDPQVALASITGNAELQQQFRLAVMANETRLDELYLADRADARKRDIALVGAGRVNRRADWMVALDCIGLVACLVAIVALRKDMSGEAITLITTLASYFGLSLRDAHQFEFGSSRGSREKDSILGGLGGDKNGGK